MPVMHVRNVLMAVHEGSMPMFMGVRVARRVVRPVRVLMMLVMGMRM